MRQTDRKTQTDRQTRDRVRGDTSNYAEKAERQTEKERERETGRDTHTDRDRETQRENIVSTYNLEGHHYFTQENADAGNFTVYGAVTRFPITGSDWFIQLSNRSYPDRKHRVK